MEEIDKFNCLTYIGVARSLGVSISRIHYSVESGYLPAPEVVLKRRPLFSPAQVEAMRRHFQREDFQPPANGWPDRAQLTPDAYGRDEYRQLQRGNNMDELMTIVGKQTVEEKPLWGRCSLGRHRWYWVVYDSWDDLVDDGEPIATGYATSPEECAIAALAVKPDANQSNTGLASNHHRKLCVLPKDVQPRRFQGSSLSRIPLHGPRRRRLGGCRWRRILFTASSDNQEYKKLGVRGEGRLATG